MGIIVYLMGKSSSGKDTVFKELLKEGTLALKTIVPYTTRPIRAGEQNGVEYFFTDEDGYRKLKQQNKVIEERTYHTVCGPWRYFTVNDGQISLDRNDYIMIGTLEAYERMKDYFGADKVLPVMIELEDGERLQRALNRERKQHPPRYEELCRRFIADSADFSEERKKEAGVERSFYNDDLNRCLSEIREYIKEAQHRSRQPAL